MPDEQVTAARRQLAGDLRWLRNMADINGRDMAVQIPGMSQSHLSRVERGLALPTRPQVEQWCRVTKAPADVRRRLLELTRLAHEETVRWGELLRGRAHWQTEAIERESEAVEVRYFDPTVITGLLQTPAYADAVMRLADVTDQVNHEAALAGRLQRQQLLYDPGRRFRFIVPERTLRWAPADDVQPGQRDRLAQVAALPSVDLAVLPEAARPAVPWHNFTIFTHADGTSYVFVELIHGAHDEADPGSVKLYRELWDRLWAASVTGDAAVEVIRRASDPEP